MPHRVSRVATGSLLTTNLFPTLSLPPPSAAKHVSLVAENCAQACEAGNEHGYVCEEPPYEALQFEQGEDLLSSISNMLVPIKHELNVNGRLVRKLGVHSAPASFHAKVGSFPVIIMIHSKAKGSPDDWESSHKCFEMVRSPHPFVGFACLVAEGEYRGGGLEGRVRSQCCVRVVVAAVECLLFVRLAATSAVRQVTPMLFSPILFTPILRLICVSPNLHCRAGGGRCERVR